MGHSSVRNDLVHCNFSKLVAIHLSWLAGCNRYLFCDLVCLSSFRCPYSGQRPSSERTCDFQYSALSVLLFDSQTFDKPRDISAIRFCSMRSFSLDFYGGMLRANNDFRDTSQQIDNPISRMQMRYDNNNFIIGPDRPVEFDLTDIFKIKPTSNSQILGWEGAISSFGPIQYDPVHSGMHVDTWLSFAPCGKMANDVFGLMKTGDSGVGSGSNMGLQLALPQKIYLNYWAHNMRRPLNPLGADDWHCGYVIYYQ